MPNDHLIEWLVCYAAIMILMLFMVFKKKLPGVGLPMAYSFNLLMNHYFGALIYALPWWQTNDYEYVYLGFQQTLYGVAAFAVGSLFLGPFFIRCFAARKNEQQVQCSSKLPMRYLQVGIVFYVFLGRVLSKIPSIGTFVQSGWCLLITSVCLFSWKAWQEKKYYKMIAWMGLALVFPFFTTFNSGFLGYGVVALMSILFFVASFFKPQWVVLVLVFFGMYLGLSLCETYFRDRGELREAIWHEQHSATERIGRVISSLSNFEFLDLWNKDHLRRIDERLNQNILVGKAVVYIRDGAEPFSRGGTLRESIVSLIPRIIWPEKPIIAGGSELVSRYTGEAFGEDTSVGIGQVMEFYINFGTPCVIFGFLILGVIIQYFDYQAGKHLLRGDWQGFAFWFLPGLGFMQSGGALVEVVSTVAAAMIFCIVIHKYLLKDFFGKIFLLKRVKR